MCVQLNMFTMLTRKILASSIIVLLPMLHLQAQEVKITCIKKTTTKPLITNIFLYGAGSRESHSNMWTASNTVSSSTKTYYGKYTDFGLGTDFYFGEGWVHFVGALGYKYKNYSYDKTLVRNSGIDSHWVSTDLKVETLNFGLGIQSDTFIKSKTHNKDHFAYNGIYPDCFNAMTLCWYFALHARFNQLKAEARIGSYIIPPLNPSKIAYYNLTNTHINGLYIEIRLNFRIFTTGSPFSSQPSIIDLCK